MELLAVIHHPSSMPGGAAVRDAGDIAAELGRVFDPIMGASAQLHTHQAQAVTVILLHWPSPKLGYAHWRQTPRGLLAAAGLPLLYCPPDADSRMLTPDDLAGFLAADNDAGALAHCGGYFAPALVRPDGVVRLATNYLGEVPLNRATHDGVTVWSNKAAVAAMLAGLPIRLNSAAARQFAIVSHCLDHQTLIKGVEVESPATIIEIDGDNIHRHPYMQLPRNYFSHRLPTDAACERITRQMAPLAAALGEADDESRLHLSGGMDSRAVGALLCHHGYRPPCITHGTPNEEVPAARRVARAIDCAYQARPGHVPTFDQFEQHIDAGLWLSDGQMSLKYHAGRYDLAFIRDGGYLPIEGLGGEYGRGYYFGYEKAFQKVTAGDFTTVLNKAIGNAAGLWPHEEDLAAIDQRIRCYLQEARDAGLDAFQATSWYYVNQKMRRWATARRNAGWTWVVDPLQMPCWTLRGMSAAPEEQTEDRLIRALTRSAWPALRNVPTVPELAYAARRRRVAGIRPVRIAYRIYDRLRPAPKPDFQDRTLAALRNELLAIIESAQPALGSLATLGDVKRWLDDQPLTYGRTELFWHMLTLARWCQLFVDRPPVIAPAVTREGAAS